MINDFPTFKFILNNGIDIWELPQAPEGWEESFIEWTRSLTDYGILRNYSIPLKWTLDGAFFLRNAFYNGGIEAVTTVTIKKLIPASLTYQDFYVGTIDYSTINDGVVTVEASIMDSGLAAKIKAYEGTVYELDLDTDPDAIEVEFGGIALQETAFLITKIFSDSFINGASAQYNSIGIQIDSFPESKITPPVRECPSNPPIGTGAIPGGNGWFFQAPIGQTVRAFGKLAIEVRPGGITANNWSIDFVTSDSIGINNVVNVGVFTVPITVGTYQLLFPYDLQIPIAINNKLWLRVTCNVGNATSIQNNPSTLTLEYFNKAPASLAKALRADKVFERLIRKISGGVPGLAQSFLLANDFSTFYYTSGDALRRIEEATLKISLRDFKKDWFSIACGGLGVENEIAVLERRDYFFRKEQRIDSLGSVQNVTFEIQDDLIYNTIKTGSPDENIDDINGRFEFNSEVQFTTPITRIKQDYDILTASRTDAYGIEFTRIDFINQTTTDSKADNKAFIIDVNIIDGFGAFPALRVDRYVSASGSPAIETVYNLALSPKQNLLRHGYFLASGLWGLENFYINWASALKNPFLETTNFIGETIIDRESIYIKTLGEKLFFPIVATVQTRYNKNLFSLINNTPYGYLEFVWMDNLYKGFILEASFNPANYEEKEFKLLLLPDNNLLSLIR